MRSECVHIGLLTPIVAIIGAKGFDEISGLWARGFGSKAPPIPPPIICIVCAMVWVKMLLAAVGSFDTKGARRRHMATGKQTNKTACKFNCKHDHKYTTTSTSTTTTR